MPPCWVPPRLQDRTEGFVAWLIPRARAVCKLTLTATRDEEAVAAMGLAGGSPLGPLVLQASASWRGGDSPCDSPGPAAALCFCWGARRLLRLQPRGPPELGAACKAGQKASHRGLPAARAANSAPRPRPSAPQLVWSNLVSALTLLGPSLRHLVMEWPDELQLGAWVATLVALEVGWPACAPMTYAPPRYCPLSGCDRCMVCRLVAGGMARRLVSGQSSRPAGQRGSGRGRGGEEHERVGAGRLACAVRGIPCFGRISPFQRMPGQRCCRPQPQWSALHCPPPSRDAASCLAFPMPLLPNSAVRLLHRPPCHRASRAGQPAVPGRPSLPLRNQAAVLPRCGGGQRGPPRRRRAAAARAPGQAEAGGLPLVRGGASAGPAAGTSTAEGVRLHARLLEANPSWAGTCLRRSARQQRRHWRLSGPGLTGPGRLVLKAQPRAALVPWPCPPRSCPPR